MSSQDSAQIIVKSRSIEKSEQDTFINKFLRPNLPYSLPLLRRCQFHQQNDKSGGSAEIWFSQVSSSTTNDRPPTKQPWIAAHIDLTNSGQTQVWTFASWESEYANGADELAKSVKSSSQFRQYETLVNSLFERLQNHHITKLPLTPPASWQRLRDTGKILSLPYSRSKVLFGTIAESIWPFLEEHVQIIREDRPYLKYVIATTPSDTRAISHLEGLSFAPMQEHHLQTIIDRTNIPRSIETLRQLANIGLFNSDDVPVAWGLLGKDASLSSLHTEPEYRRRGLAVAIGMKLIGERQAALFPDQRHDDGDTAVVIYSHADVSISNLASRNVMEKLGGKVMWRVAWIEVQLEGLDA